MPKGQRHYRYGPQCKKKTSHEDWESPSDGEAEITRLKDGRTALAHKAEMQWTWKPAQSLRSLGMGSQRRHGDGAGNSDRGRHRGGGIGYLKTLPKGRMKCIVWESRK